MVDIRSMFFFVYKDVGIFINYHLLVDLSNVLIVKAVPFIFILLVTIRVIVSEIERSSVQNYSD